MQRFLLNGSGQGLIEYLVLTSLIAVAGIGIVTLVGRNIREQYANVSHALQNKDKIKMTAPNEKQYGEKNLDDYMDR